MENLSSLLKQLPYFVSVFNLDGEITWVNRIAYGLRNNVIGKRADLLMLEDDRVAWWAGFRRVVHLREVVDFSCRIHTPEPPGWAKIDGKLSPHIVRSKVKWVVSVCYDATLQYKANPLGQFVLSPLGKKVVTYLLRVNSAKGPAIGRYVKEVGRNGQASSKLRAVLSEKVMRGILNHIDGGYSITEKFSPYAAILAAL